MTWTYDSTVISTDLGKVRTLIGDTVSTDQQLTDEQIAFFLSESSNIYAAAIACCRAIIAKYAREADRTAGKGNTTRSQRITHYQDLIKQLESDKNIKIAGISFDGSSISQSNSLDSDTDFRGPLFRRGMNDHPCAPSGANSDDCDC